MRLVNDSFHSSIMPRKQVAGKSADGVVFHAGARFGHQAGHCIPPRGVVRGCLVRDGRFDTPVNLNEQEPGRIILLLQQIKGGDAGFLHALLCVGESGLPEGVDTFRFDVDMDVNNQHAGQFSNPVERGQVRCATTFQFRPAAAGMGRARCRYRAVEVIFRTAV